MGNKAKALTASILMLVFFVIYGIRELSRIETVKALLYAVAIAVPLTVIGYRYKTRMLKVPRYVMPIGVIIGSLAYKVLSKYSEMSVITFGLLIGILMVFLGCIYNNDELDQKRGE